MKPSTVTDKKQAYELFQNQEYKKSGACFQEITRTNPQDDDAWLMQALCMQKLGQVEPAISCLERAISINPNSEKAYNYLGQAWLSKGWTNLAITNFRHAIQLKADNIEAHRNLIIALVATSQYHEAVDACRNALQYDPSDANIHCHLAVALEHIYQLEEARSEAEKALKINPGHVRANLIIAKLDKRAGNLENARVRLSAELKKNLPPLQVATLAAELGDVLDRMGNYAAAYRSFDAGNMALAKTVSPAQATQNNIFDQINRHLQWFTHSATENWNNTVLKDDKPSPIFLVGFPRSGTTLTEQVLASLDTIIPSDEQPILSRLISELPMLLKRPFRYPEDLGSLNADDLVKLRTHYWSLVDAMIGMPEDGKRLLDKLPLNIIDLGMVYRLFPDARIIVVLRDPRDCCLSCFMQPFMLNQSMVNFLSLEQSSRFYAAVMDLLAHYQSVLGLQFLEIRYEDMVADLETEARKLIEFTGEEWNDTVLNYFEHARKRDVRTPSYSAITSPIYARAIGRWHNYENQLQTALPILEPYIKAFHYQ
ncbi:MAG: sulfotransferase [Gammaproteobacteria bacterium]|nr:sulfotransferase [Gammaproteobacteria bacterium]